MGSLLPGAEGTSAPHVVFHADTDFTPAERADLQAAADVWAKQTSGLAQIRIVYDLDFTSVSSLAEHQLNLDNLLVRATNDLQMVADEDDDGCGPDDPRTERDEHACVLGWMTSGGVHNPYHRPIHGAFNVDRLVTTQYNVQLQVMIHEFGHALGLPHVDAVQAIMYPSVSVSRTSCLKKPDLVAFCQVNECGQSRMIPCE